MFVIINQFKFKAMRKVLLMAIFALVSLSFGSLNSYGQNRGPKEKIEIHSTDVSVSRGGENPNIKVDRSAMKDEVSKSRGSGPVTCWAYFHNYTDYTIDIYVDGKYKGTLGAWSDAYIATGNGYTTVYGISVGRTKEWNFKGGNCEGYKDYYFY